MNLTFIVDQEITSITKLVEIFITSYNCPLQFESTLDLLFHPVLGILNYGHIAMQNEHFFIRNGRRYNSRLKSSCKGCHTTQGHIGRIKNTIVGPPISYIKRQLLDGIQGMIESLSKGLKGRYVHGCSESMSQTVDKCL